MNKAYKIIWSHVRNCYVVVSEIARNHGKNNTKSIVSQLAARCQSLLGGLKLYPPETHMLPPRWTTVWDGAAAGFYRRGAVACTSPHRGPVDCAAGAGGHDVARVCMGDVDYAQRRVFTHCREQWRVRYLCAASCG